jgi:hypothetical protein
LYGFRKVFRGEDKDCFFHELFQRGRSDLLPGLKRPPLKKKKKLKSRSADEYDHENKQETIDQPAEKSFKNQSKSTNVHLDESSPHNTVVNVPTGFSGDEMNGDSFHSGNIATGFHNPPPNHPFHLPVAYSHYTNPAFPNFSGSVHFSTSTSSDAASQEILPPAHHLYIPPFSPWWYYARNSGSNPQFSSESQQSLPSSHPPSSIMGSSLATNEEFLENHRPPTTEDDNSHQLQDDEDS